MKSVATVQDLVDTSRRMRHLPRECGVPYEDTQPNGQRSWELGSTGKKNPRGTVCEGIPFELQDLIVHP